MSYELKPGQGSIFKNDRKTDEKHPDYKGSAMTPKGEEIELALWTKDGKNGKFFSVKIQPKYVKPEATNQANPVVTSPPEPIRGKDEDSLPF